jgi:Flp pilus assembly protein TadG
MLRRFSRKTGGQSLVEVALALPILLLLVLGIADLGRFAFYSIAVTHAARDAAEYAMKDLRVTDAKVRTRVCGEMSLDGPKCVGLVIECSRGFDRTCDTGKAAPTVRVSVHFDLPLITGLIAERLGMRTIPLHGDSTFAGYTQ